MLAAKLIEGLVFFLTVGAGLFALFLFVDLLRLRKRAKGPVYKGGMGQWTWAAHRITGVGVIAFLFGHIVDTFAVGFGPELYNETISLYQQWWFKPFEVLLIGATIFHALNGLRIILFDFWPRLAQKQRAFAYAQLVLFVIGFSPAAFFMLRSAYETSPFA
jgi:succinate dehydrogenase / fumarate reductase cytochrome b subunit